MSTYRQRSSTAVLVVGLVCVWSVVAERPARAEDPPLSIAGIWTINKDLSDPPPDRGRGGPSATPGTNGADPAQGGGGGRRGGFGGGGGGRGGFGRGGRGGGRGNPEDMARTREAMRDLMTAPERMTIVQADTMIVITGADGRTTRLSPDGKSIKDESTKIERKTKWDGGKLVSEISGLGRGKVTESYSLDSAHHQLHVAIEMDTPGGPRIVNRIYDDER